ncbi:N-acetylglucosamine kinase [Sphingobacterium litopenaei]|jgi:glucosamine kinase|uniref:N-acetylglucosamine kinase n=1 Tax=Sphingobacterium litopenaei TaxID=2763500 RepID=A0ABR7YG55_9SPHI|nr:N-acetylglucosamine kinase [Sphingobacterium litopenaei]MBD1430299.1 N-acetylglucosamine kinase [Sphingobacterium litopenaei]
MIIIADGGSTKTNWCLLDDNQKKIYFNTEGYNPYFVDSDYIVSSLKKGLPNDLPLDKIQEVNYYGAGVHNDEKAKIVSDAFRELFPNAKIEIGHDLLAAARALLGKETGFAAILGTGTNTCIYDGEKITHNISSAAYILGDEGSGSYIGKKLLTDFVRDLMPEDVAEVFYNTYKLTKDEIMDSVYTKPLANRFCASFSKFVYDNNVNIEYTRKIVDDAFEAFFSNLVSKYPNYQSYTFNCIGSVGYNFRNVLEDKATQYGMKVGKILRSPIDDLVQFHIDRYSAK